MAGTSQIKIDWDKMRSQGKAVSSHVIPIYNKGAKAITSYASELNEYSSDFTGRISIVLNEIAAKDIVNMENELTHYADSLNTTADLSEKTEKHNTQGIIENGNIVQSLSGYGQV